MEELQAKQMPSTPREVLEERRRATFAATEKIREGEALFAKAVGAITTVWGALLKYETTEKITQSAREEDEKINAAKVEMRKLPLQ